MLDTIRALGPSIVRTVTPMIVGLLVTLAARAGFEWEPTPEVTAIVSTLVGALWYAVIRILETRGAAAWGKLLGSTSQPVYVGKRRKAE